MRKCTIEGCERKHYARGWCNLHWTRWRINGDPMRLVWQSRGVCSIPGCDRPHEARGWCSLHYKRWKASGSPLGVVGIPRWCRVDGCERRERCKGLCERHYQRFRKYGDPLGGGPQEPQDPLSRALALVVEEPAPAHLGSDALPCWIIPPTQVATRRIIRADGRNRRAYHIIYESLVAPIPDGLTIDHLCLRPECVNPFGHLEPVPKDVNSRRAAAARRAGLVGG